MKSQDIDQKFFFKQFVERLHKSTFTTQELYVFKDELQSLYPDNKDIRAAMRLMLQKLRNEGYLEFISRGQYRLKQTATTEHLGQQGGVQPAADALSADNRQSAEITEGEVHEGYDQDRANTFRTRNAEIIARRRAHDDFTCLSCGLRLSVNGVFIIDCHHKYPIREGERITNLDDLVCLCPTCHRIAHSRTSPLTVSEIQSVRQAAGLTVKM